MVISNNSDRYKHTLFSSPLSPSQKRRKRKLVKLFLHSKANGIIRIKTQGVEGEFKKEKSINVIHTELYTFIDI